MRVRGSLDVVAVDHAAGWIFSPDSPAKFTVVAMINREIIGEAVADLARPDLAAAGLGDGLCGFRIEFYKQIDPAYLPFVVVHPEGSDTQLPRYSPTGFVEFFQAVYREYPHAGRQRSVYGGLWIDRTDARAMLKGKVAIGQIDKETARSLEELILDGITVLPVGVLPADTEPTQKILSTALSTSILKVLEAAFDDHAIALHSALERESRPPNQASAEVRSPSPAECMLLIAPVGDDPIVVHVNRSSGALPEFSVEGRSRWLPTDAPPSHAPVLVQTGMVDSTELKPGMAVLVAPGTIHAVQLSSAQATTLRVRLVPSRWTPMRAILGAVPKDTGTIRAARPEVTNAPTRAGRVKHPQP